MKKKSNKRDSILFAGVLFIIFFILSVYNQQQAKRRNLKPKFTIGEVIYYNLKGKRGCKYKYYANGKYFIDNEITNKKLNLHSFYKVKYEDNNPYNSELLYESEKIEIFKLPERGIELVAEIEKKYDLGEGYYDLYMKYEFENKVYRFRTRLNHSEITKYKLPNYSNEKILKIQISKEYPLINDLYLKSYDRKSKIDKDTKLNIEYFNLK